MVHHFSFGWLDSICELATIQYTFSRISFHSEIDLNISMEHLNKSFLTGAFYITSEIIKLEYLW